MAGPPTVENAVSALSVDTASLGGFDVRPGSVVPPGAIEGFDVKGTRERGRWLDCANTRLAGELTSEVLGVPAATSPLPLIAPGPTVGLEPAAAGAPGLIAVVPAGPETFVLGT